MTNLTPLLTSKRMWVLAITFLLHTLLTHYGLKLTDADTTSVATNLVLAAGAIALATTKLMDARKA